LGKLTELAAQRRVLEEDVVTCMSGETWKQERAKLARVDMILTRCNPGREKTQDE
jgi:hypothetical protein